MFTNFLKSFLIITLLFITGNGIFAQEIGEIFTATKADSLFGEVVESIEIKTSELERWLDLCKDKIMFRLEDNQLHVLDGKRYLIASNREFIDDWVVFKLYSKSKVEELILLGGKEITTFENRKEVFSVTNGSITLEMAVPCPPRCRNEYYISYRNIVD